MNSRSKEEPLRPPMRISGDVRLDSRHLDDGTTLTFYGNPEGPPFEQAMRDVNAILVDSLRRKAGFFESWVQRLGS